DDSPAGRRQVAEVVIAAGSPLVGRPVAEAAGPHQAQVLAHVPGGAPARFLLDVAPHERLAAGDRLVVCGPPHQLAALLGRAADRDPTVRWANPLRRNLRVLWRTLSEVDLSVKICTGVLLLVIAGSTLTLHLSWDKQSIADAFFRTISLMATGADMHPED